MSINYYYNFALIDRATNMCMEVRTCTDDESESSNENTLYVPIPEYSEEYLLKYYNEADGKFYYDAEFTQEFVLA